MPWIGRVSEIRELNPSLLKGIAPQGSELRVPKGTANTLLAALESVPAAKRDSWRMHRVEKDETLAAIAKRFGTPASAIVSANNGALGVPEAGDVLLIPAAYREPVVTPAKRVVRGRRAATPHASAAHARTVAAKAPAQNTGVHHVPAKVLNQRAPARRVRTASVGSTGGQ